MRFLYSFLMCLLIPFILIRLWLKGKSLPAYRQRLSERFFLGTYNYKPIDVWLHAVSLGEVIAATPLIDAMLAKNWSLLVTTMTPTGSKQVQTRFGEKVAHQYLPYDLPWILKRFFKQIQPQIGVIMETELWPNLIHQAHAAKIPLVLANARISNDSLQGYKRIKFLIKTVLNQFSAILAQADEDAKRYMTLGARKEIVHMLGNMKFDLQTNSVDTKRFNELKNHWGVERVIVIAASTHDNEESQLLSQLRKLQEAIPGVVFLIAPRHPERFQSVYQLSLQSGFKTGLRSDLTTLNAQSEVVILDSLGELLGFYEISDYAFVGGSLVSVGGHNVLEPIAMNTPVLSGNQIHNFKAICDELQAARGILLVERAEEVINGIIKLHADVSLCEQMNKNARAVFEKNKGSVVRHLKQIEELKRFNH